MNLDYDKLFRSISNAPPSSWPMNNYIKLLEHKDIKLGSLVELIRKRKFRKPHRNLTNK